MESGVRNVIFAQLILTAVAALAFFAWQGGLPAVSALYGGGIALVNSLLLARRLRKAGDEAGTGVALTMYAGAAQRFITTLVGFGIGIGLLQLPPLAQIAAFAAAQLGFVIAAGRQRP